MRSRVPPKGTPEYAEFMEARVLDNLERQVERAARIYYHHPKYGRHRNYPHKLTRLFPMDERIDQNNTRLQMFNWLNANCRGNWSIDETYPTTQQMKLYELSFAERSDILIFKLVWGNG